MPSRYRNRIATASLLLIGLLPVHADDKPKFLIPDYTLSPDHRYGVTVPIFEFPEDEKNEPTNKVVEAHTKRVLATIHASTGYVERLNFHETLPARWSRDNSLLVWEVEASGVRMPS
jgi:hypothetical protein